MKRAINKSRDKNTLITHGPARKTAKKFDKAFAKVSSFVVHIYNHIISNRSLGSHSKTTISGRELSIKHSVAQ